MNLNLKNKFFFYNCLYFKQEFMDIHWQKINLKEHIKHGVLEREKGEVLSYKWKYLIRK
jgi:hypothetical protein